MNVVLRLIHERDSWDLQMPGRQRRTQLGIDSIDRKSVV